MGLFEQLKGGQQQPINPAQAMQQLRQNPSAFLSQAGYNIPANMTNPQQILQHLMQSGQVGNNRVQQIIQMLGARR